MMMAGSASARSQVARPIPRRQVHSWMREMAAHLRVQDPNHLIALGTEGFFMPDDRDYLHQFNPGAGAQCEGGWE